MRVYCRVNGILAASLLLAGILFVAPLAAHAASTAKEILARMDKEAAGFRSVSADITRVKYTAILDDRSEEQGSMVIRRTGKNLESKIQIEKPNPRAVAFSGNKVEIYYPKINTVQEFDVGKNRGLVDQFLLLGFGGSGKDLAKAYQVTVKGAETVAGVATTRLLLSPKSPKVRELLKSVEIWVPDGAAHPIRQKFVEPSDDYMEVTYREVKLNPALSNQDVRLDLPADVKREYPQR